MNYETAILLVLGGLCIGVCGTYVCLRIACNTYTERWIAYAQATNLLIAHLDAEYDIFCSHVRTCRNTHVEVENCWSWLSVGTSKLLHVPKQHDTAETFYKRLKGTCGQIGAYLQGKTIPHTSHLSAEYFLYVCRNPNPTPASVYEDIYIGLSDLTQCSMRFEIRIIHDLLHAPSYAEISSIYKEILFLHEHEVLTSESYTSCTHECLAALTRRIAHLSQTLAHVSMGGHKALMEDIQHLCELEQCKKAHTEITNTTHS
jgi:hypothetical protein